MQKSLFRNRPGYTLIEVATSVTVVAILTAAILPVVVKQIDDAEPTRLANDLGSMAKAIETFHLNVRPTFPSDMYQLTTKIEASSTGSVNMNGGLFLDKHVDAWKGPYISVNFATLSSTLTSGFGAAINSQLYWFNSTPGTPTSNVLAGDQNGEDFIAIRISGLTIDEFNKLNNVVDGSDFTSSTGRVRFDGTHAFFLSNPAGD